MQALIGDQIGQNRMQSVHQETHHFARADSAEPPKGPTWIHFVALHFSPLMVGQLPCRLVLSVSPFGVRLQGSTRVGVLRIEVPDVSAGTNLIHGVQNSFGKVAACISALTKVLQVEPCY